MRYKIDAILLAGGKGRRMEGDLPKPLVNVLNKPIIEHQIDYLRKNSLVENIILSLGYKSDVVIKHIEENYKSDNKILCAVESSPLGTGGGLKNAIKLAKNNLLLVLNVDNISDVNIDKLALLKNNQIVVSKRYSPYGKVDVDKDGNAIFIEKPLLENWTSIGWYLFNKDDLLDILPDVGSLEYDVFPKLKMKLYKHEGFIKSLNSKKDIEDFEKEVTSEEIVI